VADIDWTQLNRIPIGLVTGTNGRPRPRGSSRGWRAPPGSSPPARFEHRGGVEDNLAVAAKRIAAGGWISVCTSASSMTALRLPCACSMRFDSAGGAHAVGARLQCRMYAISMRVRVAIL
jgi:hypothetical protein